MKNHHLAVPYLCRLFMLVIASSGAVNAQDDGITYRWELKKDEEGIRIYTSAVPNSKYNAVRTSSKIESNIQGAVALVQDLSACSQWADLCVKSELVETISANEEYIYTYNNVPFPVKDRDVVSHVVWQHDPVKRKISMFSNAVEGKVPESSKAVRIIDAVAQWHFTTLDENTTLVESYAHIDPAGPTPAWLSNLLLIGSPFKTLQNMRKILELGGYQNASVELLGRPIQTSIQQ